MIQARANAAAKARKDIDKAFLNYDFSKYKITPLWDLAVVAKNKKSVEVPYTINGKLLMPSVSKTLKGRQRLLLTLNGSKVSVLIMQYIPYAKFAGNTKEIYAENFKSKKFTGKITLQKIDSEEKTVWVLDLGKVSKKLISRKTAKKNLRPTEWVCTYWEQETDWYQWNSGTEEWYYTNTTIEYGEDCEYVDDTPPYDPYDCNNNSSWPWCDNGNGGGGGDFGSTTSDWGSDFTYSVHDQCGGFSGMWLRQFAESKEIVGFLTSSGQVIIAPSNGNTYDRGIVANAYDNENGNRILYLFQDNGTWKVELYNSSGVAGTYDITGIVHTHPYPIGATTINNFPSDPYDLGVAASYPQLDHYILTTAGKIHYNQNGTISNHGRNCY